jgi:hypothetical protein
MRARRSCTTDHRQSHAVRAKNGRAFAERPAVAVLGAISGSSPLERSLRAPGRGRSDLGQEKSGPRIRSQESSATNSVPGNHGDKPVCEPRLAANDQPACQIIRCLQALASGIIDQRGQVMPVGMEQLKQLFELRACVLQGGQRVIGL